MTPNYITFSNIIIDDIVLWDGRTLMGTLGGAGTHALIGMRTWSDSLGFAAVVGEDFAPDEREQLAKISVDLSGVLANDAGAPTARAWQILEEDDRRFEVFRTDIDDFFRYTPSYDTMPQAYRQARGVHLMWGKTFDAITDLIDRWHEENSAAKFAWEPALEYLNGPKEEFAPILQRLDLFSPDSEQAEELTGLSNPIAMAKELLNWGPPIVAVRCGAEGSIVATAEGDCWQIPAVPPRELVDVTGAGNAYCGGFVVGLGEGLDVLGSALRGAVSASFALEQFGVPDFGNAQRAEAEKRLVWVRQQVG